MLLITLSVAMIGFQFIGAFIAFLLVFPFYDGSLMEFALDAANPLNDADMRVPLLVMQGIASGVGFIVMPMLLMRYYYQTSLSKLASLPISPTAILLTCLLVPFFMGFNSPFIEWNQELHFPAFLSGLESKLKAMEEMLQSTSTFITNFENNGQFLLGLLVVAVVPGIGEELVFRGLVQNHVFRISKNIHVAIWIGALLFSLFHLQFYGLVPRMFLGVLFGYLYYFSGSLVYPMIAHFFNNGFTLLMLHLYNQKIVTFNIEDSDSLPIIQIAITTVIAAFLIIAFKFTFQRKSNDQLGKSL